MLDNATLPSSPNTASGAGDQVSITPNASGGLVYSSTFFQSSSAPIAAGGNTAIDNIQQGIIQCHGNYVSSSTTTAATAFTAGSGSSPTTPDGVAALEVQKYGGSIATNASSPAVVNSSGATAGTTAAFSPPAGSKLILAMVTMGGNTGTTPAVSVSDSYGLTWTEAVKSNTACYAGIWYAYTPASVAIAGTPGNGLTGVAYSSSFTASGGYGGYTYSLASGTLPTGLSLSGAGVISGTPTVSGLYSFAVTVTDSFGSTATTGTLYVVINTTIAGGGSIAAGWNNAAGAYFYGTLETPVSTAEHDWVFVSASWQDTEDAGIAYCADSAGNLYQPVAFSNSGTVNTLIFAAPNARAASTVYVSTSAFVRYLTVTILDVAGLQPGLTIDASQLYSGGPSTSLPESLSTTHPDFILAVGAFAGTPQTITQSGSGVTWTSLGSAINGTASAGITQASAWAVSSGAASPARTFTAASSGLFSGAMVAVYTQGGLAANANPAWPVISCQAAFGYTPQEPTALPTWTDITSRFLGLNGQRGRSFELDELAAADLTLHLDNFDGALSPGGALGATLITPVRLLATWQGRTYPIFRGIVTAIPQAYDFQRTMIAMALTDDWSKLATTLLPTCMIMEMLYDKPLHLWPLNEQQGATSASNWSSRTTTTLAPVKGSSGGGLAPAGGTVPSIRFLGTVVPVQQLPASLAAQIAAVTAQSGASSNSSSNSSSMTTGFGQQNAGTYPAGLAGTQDSVWANVTTAATSTLFQGTALVDSNDSSLPLTSTGATYSVWAQMLNVPVNYTAGATVMALTDQNGTAGGKEYLAVSYDGTNVTVSQTAGSHTFTPSSILFDGNWHLWTATISTGGTITVYLDGAVLGSFAGTMPLGTPTMLQFGGDTTISPTGTAGFFTGSMSLAGDYDRVVDPERILSWYQSGATGFLDELAGVRIQRILAWARWNAPQAVDPGLSMQQQFNYIAGGYANNGLTGAIGHANTAGGSTAVDQGASADVTIQDVANTDNGFLAMRSDGTVAFIQRDRIGNFPVGLALGDMDYALNTWQTFESGLGPWTSTVSCTVAQSSGWSYSGKHSALVTVTGTPVTAYAWGDKANVTPGETVGFSCWVMSPQGCSVILAIDFYNASSTYISTSYGDVYGNVYLATYGALGVSCPPMTPVFLDLPGVTAPAGAAYAYPHPMLVSSPATGTQLYFDRARLSPAGFQVPYEGDVQITEDIQYLFNDIAVTRNVDQASYRARDTISRGKYYPRIYTRTIFSSVDDATAVQNNANFLLSGFSAPALRVPHLVIDAATNPEAWPFVLSADIGDSVSFTRTPVGGTTVTGTFTILSVQPDIGRDKAQFTYVLAPGGVF